MTAWTLRYDEYDARQEGLREALCTLGNGYFATRGAMTDSPAGGVHYPGTYLAGGYNRLTTEIDGRPIENESLVNLPNWLSLTFRIDGGAWFRLDEVEVVSFRQELDLARGVLRRDMRIRDAEGRTTRWDERRIVSMADPHLAGLSVELTAEDWTGLLTVRSALDGSVTNDGVPRYRDLAGRHLDALALDHVGSDTIVLNCRTSQSLIAIAQAARTRVYRDDAEIAAGRETHILDGVVAQEVSCAMPEGAGVTVEKIVALYTSRDHAICEPGLEAKNAVDHAGRFDVLLAAHALAWDELWDECDVQLEDGVEREIQLKVRLHIFHLLQTASPHTSDLDVGIPARGWHGEAYRGHIFWDEVFVFPYLSLHLPTLARSLLQYRYRRLPEARRAARDAGFAGAMFPWQSGSNGREENQLLHLNPVSGRWLPDNTHRQHHINSTIAYNVWRYYEVTGDHEYLYSYGAEMMFEIARFWASIATYNSDIDRFEIKGVMGPDEFHTAYPGADPDTAGGVDNNAYTNVMAAWVLSRAVEVAGLLPAPRGRHLCERLALDPGEVDRWHEISRKLRVPFHEGVISQFDGYAALDEFDWKGYEREHGDIQRLDRILEAEGDTPNRYKASKQADVLMLFYLFSAEELALLLEQLGYPFDRDTIPRTIDYYIARTSHGSTLSKFVHSWVLARSDRAHSWELFGRALDSDVADVQGGTTQEGIHIGAMAGTIDLVQRCYLGIEMRANTVYFDPALPDDIRRIKVKLRCRGYLLDVEADHDTLTIRSKAFNGVPLALAYRNQFRDITASETFTFKLIKAHERMRDENRGL
jgi:alpha,alpha-trehalase